MEQLEEDLRRVKAAAIRLAAAVRCRMGDRVHSVTLYGSAARGDWTRESDVDVLILLDEASPVDVDGIARLALDLGLGEEGLLIQPVVMSRERFEHLRKRERIYALDVLREGTPM